MLPDLENLLRKIEQKLDWGKSESWQGRDFENLNELILEETGVSLSASTLRRIWGRVEYKHLPSATTLDTLSKFAGFENWRQFQKSQLQPVTEPTPVSVMASAAAPSKKPSAWRNMAWIVGAILVIGLVSIFGVKKSRRPIKVSEYSFSSRPLTHSIPNSVIFTYDATQAPTDSIFIQQSWDSHTRTLVEKDQHQHTSIYYEPGFYRAKLFVDTVLVQEHPLIIPTDGWLGLIENKPVPVYLKQEAFVQKDSLFVAIAEIAKNNLSMQPMPPIVKYFNVGNFKPVPVESLSFSTELRNGYRDGSAACQMSAIILITDGSPIIISLSVRGCASELGLMSVDQNISGKKADLSGFTVDFSSWAKVSCKADSGMIHYYVNDKPAFQCALPKKPVQIVGMAYLFQGTGSVKNVRLLNGDKTVFSAF